MICDPGQKQGTEGRVLPLPLEAKLPPLLPGKVRWVIMNAAAAFWGYKDEWPDAETAVSVMKAEEILAAGVANMAIERARRCT